MRNGVVKRANDSSHICIQMEWTLVWVTVYADWQVYDWPIIWRYTSSRSVISVTGILGREFIGVMNRFLNTNVEIMRVCCKALTLGCHESSHLPRPHNLPPLHRIHVPYTLASNLSAVTPKPVQQRTFAHFGFWEICETEFVNAGEVSARVCMTECFT